MNVIAGRFAVLDAEGNALCHAPSANKRANGKVLATARANWLKALDMAGLVKTAHPVTGAIGSGTWILCTDMVWRDRGAGEPLRDGFVDFGHDRANSLLGAYCGCNALPVEGATNRADGDSRPTVHAAWPADAYAVAFRNVALGYMTKTKAARAI